MDRRGSDRALAVGVSFFRRHPLLSFFALAYAGSAIGLVVLGPPHLSPAGTQNPASLAVFPVLIVGVAAAGVVMTAATGGRPALAELASGLRKSC